MAVTDCCNEFGAAAVNKSTTYLEFPALPLLRSLVDVLTRHFSLGLEISSPSEKSRH